MILVQQHLAQSAEMDVQDGAHFSDCTEIGIVMEVLAF